MRNTPIKIITGRDSARVWLEDDGLTGMDSGVKDADSQRLIEDSIRARFVATCE